LSRPVIRVDQGDHQEGKREKGGREWRPKLGGASAGNRKKKERGATEPPGQPLSPSLFPGKKERGGNFPPLSLRSVLAGAVRGEKKKGKFTKIAGAEQEKRGGEDDQRIANSLA